PPGERPAGELAGVGDRTSGTGAGIRHLLPLGVRRTGRLLDVRPRAGARVDEFLFLQPPECGFVEGDALSLHHRTVVPVQPEPAEVGERLVGRPGFDPRRVDVLDPQDDSPGCFAGQQPSDQVRAGVADVLGPGRRRGESGHEGTSHRGIRGWIRDAFVYIGAALLTPLWLPAVLERRLWLGEECFTFAAQLLSLVPGKPGIFARRSFYLITIDRCATDCHIGFGT